MKKLNNLVGTCWGSEHSECMSKNSNQYNLEMSLVCNTSSETVKYMLQKQGDNNEDIQENSKKSIPTQNDWELYAQYEES